MLATRYKNDSTSINLRSLIEAINNPSCASVTLYGAQGPQSSHPHISGNHTNSFLWVAALATFSFSRVEDLHIVFDGMFLHTASSTRYDEAIQLLDVAEQSSKVTFAIHSVPCTSAMPTDIAAKILLETNSTLKVSSDSRVQYFTLLSGHLEEQYAQPGIRVGLAQKRESPSILR